MTWDEYVAAWSRLHGGFVYYASVYTMDSVGAIGFAYGSCLGDWVVIRTQARFQLLSRMLQEFPLDPKTVKGG